MDYRFVHGVLAVALFLPTYPTNAQSDAVRVRIFADDVVTSATLVAIESPLVVRAAVDHDPVTTIPVGDSLYVRRGVIDLHLLSRESEINTGEAWIDAAGGAIEVFVETSTGGGYRRSYAGSLHFSSDPGARTLKVVNEVDIETYVASVVAKEYALDDVEGTRAMAVLARTFAVRAMNEGGGAAADGVSAQVYRGVDVITDKSRAAAESTRGTILSHDGAPIVAVYSASNGGYSANNADVWSGEPLPYLRSRRDRYDSASSPYKDWSFRISADALHEAVARNTGRDVESLVIAAKGRDDRVQRVTIKHTEGPDSEISGTSFRSLVVATFGTTTLKSTRFDLKRRGDDYEFTGSGFGHGVGLSQWGAHEMAKRDYNHEEILRHYFPGTRLMPLREVTAAESPRLALREPDRVEPETDTSRAVTYGVASDARVGWVAVAEPSRANRSRRVGW